MCTISSKKGFDADILFQKGFLVGDESETFDCKNVQSEFCVCPDTSPPVKIEMGLTLLPHVQIQSTGHLSLKLSFLPFKLLLGGALSVRSIRVPSDLLRMRLPTRRKDLVLPAAIFSSVNINMDSLFWGVITLLLKQYNRNPSANQLIIKK